VINFDGLDSDSYFYMAGYQKSDFKNGKLQVSPSFRKPGLEFTDYAGKTFEQVAGELKNTSSDAIFTVNFSINDKSGRELKKESIKFVFADNGQVKVSPTASSVVVNDKNVSFEAYNIGGNNYFKLRDIAMAVDNTKKQFEVGWDKEKNAINLIPNKAYTSVGGELEVKSKSGSKVATPSNSKIYLDGKEVQLTAYNIDGNNYFKLRDIGKAFNIGVTWDGKANKIVIDTNADYKESDESSSNNGLEATPDKIPTETRIEVADSKGSYVTITNIVDEVDTGEQKIYFVNAPTVITFHGDDLITKYIITLPNAERVNFSGDSATITLPGDYHIRASSDSTSDSYIYIRVNEDADTKR